MTLLIAGAVIAAPQSFDPIHSVEFSRQNILTGDDFVNKSRLKTLIDHLIHGGKKRVSPLVSVLTMKGDPDA